MLGAWILTGIESGLLYTALGVFGGASVVALRVVSGRREGRSLRPMLGVGAVVLTLLLVAIALREGTLPLLRRWEVLLAAAWGLAAGAWFVSRRTELPILAAVTAPTLALLVFFALLLVTQEGTGAPTFGLGKWSHIVLAVLGFAGFSVAAGVGVLYLWQIRLMKRDPSAAVARRMPSLEKLDRVNFLAAAFGLPFLALSVLAGWLFIATGPDGTRRWWLDPTVLATVGGLLVYVVLFVSRGLLGWYGRRIAWLSVIGFLVAVVGFVLAAFCTSPNTLHG